MANERFTYNGLNRREFDLIVKGFNLNEPPKRADALQPEMTTEEMARGFLEDFINSRVGVGQLSIAQVGQLLQRMVWMDAEIKSLRRTNRNVRSKNRRLDKLRQPKPELLGDVIEKLDVKYPGYRDQLNGVIVTDKAAAVIADNPDILKVKGD